MPATAPAIRSRHDSRLHNELLAANDVQRALKRLKEQSAGYGFGFRHELLASGLRLTRRMSPDVAAALEHCRDRLGIERPIEVFVTRSEGVNAFCTRSLHGPLMIGLTSKLLETFDDAELRFVLGHELGHAAFDHFSIPMPALGRVEDLAGRVVTRPTLLRLFLWSRSAELSADRAGLVCAESAEAAASAFFKTATGITSRRIKFEAEDFMQQSESLAAAPLAYREGREEDYHLACFSAHPYSPLRVRALLLFAKSRLFADVVGKGQGELTLEALEDAVEKDLRRMEPTYLEESTARSVLMRRALFFAGMTVALADGVFHEGEREALKMLLGKDYGDDGITIEAAREKLSAEVPQLIKEVPAEFRVQLVQHLAVIAGADGDVDTREREEMYGVAAQLQVDLFVVDSTLNAINAPLD